MVRPIQLGPSSAQFSSNRSVFNRQENAFTIAGDISGDLLTGGVAPNLLNLSPSDAAVLAITALAAILQSSLGGNRVGNNAALSGGIPQATGPVQGQMSDAQLSAALDQQIVGGSPQERAQLKQSLLQIGSDPDGRKLLEDNLARGNTFAVGNPESAINGQADAVVKCNCPIHQAQADNSVQRDVLGVTLSKGANSPAQIIVGDPNNIKTLAHEMVHGATTGDGNSLAEESTANIIGKRVAERLGAAYTGANATNISGIINETLPNYFGSGLESDNGIYTSLLNLGIDPGVNVGTLI